MRGKFLVFIALLALQTAGRALQAPPEDSLRLAAEAIGAMDVERLRYSGSGSSYAFGVDADGQETRNYERVADYVQEVDHSAVTAQMSVTRLVGELRTEQVEDRQIGQETPWEEQISLWLNPHLFLQKALSENTSVEVERERGVEYTVARFETPSGHQVSGYIDQQNFLRRIRARFVDPELGERTVEGSFLYYEDFEGTQFPTIVVHKQNGLPSLILVVKEVEASSRA